MRAALARIGSAMVLLLVLTSCTPAWSGLDNSGGKTVLTVWYWNRSIEDDLFREFEKLHPDIEVKNQKIGGDYNSKVRTTLAGKSYIPDVLALNVDIATYFPASDQFVNLYDLGAAKIEPDYLPWKWKLGQTPDGVQMGVPTDIGPTALYYRADLFQKAGLPGDPAQVAQKIKTWDDYIAAGKQMQQKLPGVFMVDNITRMFNQQIRQQETLFVNRDNVYVGNDDQVKHAWDTAASMIPAGVSAEVQNGTPDRNAALSNGTVASFVGAAWEKQILMDAAPQTAGKWRIAPAPGRPGNDGGSFLTIPKASKHQQEAYELISFLQSPQNSLRQQVNMQLFPSTPWAYTQPEFLKPDEFFGGQVTNEIFAKAARNVPNIYYSPADNVVGPPLNDNILEVGVSGKDPQTAWNDAQSRIKRELEHKMPDVKLEGK